MRTQTLLTIIPTQQQTQTATINLIHPTTTMAANKANNRLPFMAMAFGAGLFLLLQLVANRILARQEANAPSPSSKMISPSFSSTSVHRPIDLFADEFFSSPFMIDSDLLALKNEMDRQFQELDRHFQGDSGAFSPLLRLGGRTGPSTSLWGDYEVKEDDKKVTVTVSFPEGVRVEDINIEVIDGDVMHISGGRKMEKDGVASETWFEKRFALGRHMDQANIAAKVKSGTLTITTPKVGHAKEKEVRKIPIKEEL